MGETRQLSGLEQQCLDLVNEGGYTSYQFVAQRVGRGYLRAHKKVLKCMC
jgi:hypothetical protein